MSLIKPPAGTLLKPGHPLAKGLVGCWLFNEGFGCSTVRDLSGNENDGTMTNMIPGYPSDHEFITNGGFDTDSGWTKQTGWTISGGAASCDGSQSGTSSIIQGSKVWVVGSVYIVAYTISNYSAGSVRALLAGDGASAGTWQSSNGAVVEYIEVDTIYDSNFYIQADADFVGVIDNVSVKPATYISSWQPGPDGWTLEFDGSNDYVDCGGIGVVGFPVTLFSVVTSGNAGFSRGISIANTSEGDEFLSLLLHNTSDFVRYSLRGDGGVSGDIDYSIPVPSNTTFTLCGVSQSANDHYLYVNGKLVGTSSTSLTFTGLNKTTIGAVLDNTPSYGVGKVSYSSIYNRALSAEEVHEISNNPYQIFGYEE